MGPRSPSNKLEGITMRGLFFVSVLSLLFLGAADLAAAQAPVGRFQLVAVSGQQSTLFLLDTVTGCTWQLAQNPETKRLAFSEMDVENLHWSWGSGSQQILAQKIEASNQPEEQKRVLKEELRRTACGWTLVVLTPGPGEIPAKK